MKKIDFFIVGAAKSGTTALYEILKEHSEVFLPNFKEPHYFANDLEKYKAHDNPTEYFSMYNGNEDKIWGDASIFNMYSDVAIANIMKHNSNAKIIIMLRKQLATIPSIHSQLLFTQDETENNIENAWDLTERRRTGIKIPKSCKCPKILDYKRIFKYSYQIDRIKSLVSEENLHIILHDDFVNNPDNELRKIEKFLYIKENQLVNKISNENEVNIIPFISRVLRHPPSSIKKIKRLLIGRRGKTIYKKILSLNSIVKKREQTTISMKNKILDEYISDIEKLELIINRDLTMWKR